MAIEVEAETLTIRQLRRRWKPHKERLTAEQPENPTPIRFHRACSWIAPVEQNAANEDHDLGLISLWIAFNSLPDYAIRTLYLPWLLRLLKHWDMKTPSETQRRRSIGVCPNRWKRNSSGQ
jgi:hypothetical protein